MTGAIALPALEDLYDVPPERVEEFREKGHTSLTGLASADEVAAYRPLIKNAAEAKNRETRPLEERDTYGKAFLQTPNLWRVNDEVKRFVFARRFAKAAADLLEVEGVRLYHDQALFKEAGGGHTPWHQDQVYWPLDTEKTITMWMPLIDLPPEVGSMTFVSGSHRHGDLGGQHISDESEAEFDAMLESKGLRGETHGALKAGDATFHAGWTLHRAGNNPTGALREVMTIIYFADGARVSEPDSPFQEYDMKVWLKGLGPGDLAAGERNPLLWSRSG